MKKNILIFMAGIILGVVLTSITHNFLLQKNGAIKRVLDSAKTQTSQKIMHNEMLVLSHSNGIALVDFTSLRNEEADYRWRFLDSTSNTETNGTGTVFEKYKRVLGTPLVKDDGSSLYIVAGPLWIQWSYASTDSAWIYYHKGTSAIKVLPDSEFNSIELNEF